MSRHGFEQFLFLPKIFISPLARGTIEMVCQHGKELFEGLSSFYAVPRPCSFTLSCYQLNSAVLALYGQGFDWDIIGWKSAHTERAGTKIDAGERVIFKNEGKGGCDVGTMFVGVRTHRHRSCVTHLSHTHRQLVSWERN